MTRSSVLKTRPAVSDVSPHAPLTAGHFLSRKHRMIASKFVLLQLPQSFANNICMQYWFGRRET